MRTTCVIAVLLATASWARADGGRGSAVSCTTQSKRKARAVADRAVKAKDYKLAIATLEPYAEACPGTDSEPIETAWLSGDLAVAYELAGDYVACIRLMEPLVFPKSDVARAGNDKLSNALQFNFDHCSKKLDAQYAALASEPCPFPTSGGEHAVAVPADLVPKSASSACLALVTPPLPKASADDDSGLAPVACPQVVLFARGKGKPTSRVLGKALDDDEFCCGVDHLAVGIKDGKPLVRVTGDGWIRECHGGTATKSLDIIYEWTQNTLALLVDASVGLW